MTTKQAIDSIYAPKGMTSILTGLMTGDYSVIPHDKGKGSDLEKANEMVAKYQKDIDNCTSDWSYWSILGDLEYWKAIRNILEAAALVGNDNLADIPTPNTEGKVVMDAIYEVTKFGDAILKDAQSRVATNHQ